MQNFLWVSSREALGPCCLLVSAVWRMVFSETQAKVPKPRLSVLDHWLKTGYSIVAGGSLFQRMRGKSSCLCVCFSVFGADCIR